MSRSPHRKPSPPRCRDRRLAVSAKPKRRSNQLDVLHRQGQNQNGAAWIPERSATRLRKADLNVLSKLGNQGLEWRLEPEAFTGGEVRREDDLLDFLVGCPVDIEVARQPSA